jgi:WD40 repeat protein
VSGGKEVASLAGHTSSVYSVAFSPDGQHIVSGSLDKLVKVCEEGGCVAGWTHELCLVGRLQSRWATFCFRR